MKKSVLLLLACIAMSCQFIKAQTPLKPRDTTITGPQNFAVVMGISKYKFVRPLNYADKDAELFRNYLKSPGGGRLSDDNIYLLLNDQANETNFQVKFKSWLKSKKLQKGDRLFMYLAGHGDAIDKDQFFYLTYDCNPAGDKNNYLVNGAIRMYDIKTMIAKEVGKGVEVFLIMDACRSNELPGGAEGLGFFSSAISEQKVGEVMMLASAAGQESLEDASIGNGHGLFTWYLVDGLSGLADAGKADSKITFAEIKNYVEKNVPSVATEKFKRKQDPYLCCNEFSEKVVSNVDPTYLQQWLKEKNNRRGGSNSFNGITAADFKRFAADTALVETYNRFNRAIRSNNLTGSSSAEDFYQQLEKKYPGNPYTQDAKSSLAAEFINDAQKKVNQYLTCGVISSSKDKQEHAAAGGRIEKAIALLRADEPEFAAALRGRMFLLKANGDYGTTSAAFDYAHAARAIDPNGGYILNQLSRLHLENNRPDSAAYYADKAAKAAPKWPCALTTLALAQKALDNKKPDLTNKGKKPSPKLLCKPSFGFTLGGGLNQSNPTYSGNQQTGFTGVNSKSAAGGNAGFLYHICLGPSIAIRPTATVLFESTDIEFERRSTSGGPIIETISVKGTTVSMALPLLIRLSSGKLAPYIALGPSFNYMLSQNGTSADQLPVKKSLFMGNGGLGLDISLMKSGWVLSPELKYSAGLNDINSSTSTTVYSAALGSLKKNTFSLNLYLRKR